ncbi:hypothetical protein FRB94_006819 [Tulasnella sp. JGI-2019a]|nr:hypothetical protein FRB93_010368 [Tulasnella sp. JGI-2019a]KAG9012019.1 hypothetical protein FRB94_006819 [Tulasnella sp. JGI-2019a]KAG9030657.1 hypothetical protein FRB95_003672 [Tulasnella sp. JGI-2019a]
MSSANSKLNSGYTLFHAKSCCSTLILVQLRVLEIPHEVVTLSLRETLNRVDSPGLKRLLAANPMAQFPTLVTPEGTIVTETAAIILYLNDRHGSNTPWGTSSLSPIQLASFYRWLVFLPANVFTTVNLVEHPGRFVIVPEDSPVQLDVVQSWVWEAGNKKRGDVWRVLEERLGKAMPREEGKPFLLGTEHPTMLDVYMTLLAHWTNRPRYSWMEENCPTLFAICKKTMAASDIVRQTFEENECDAFMGKASHAKLLDRIP